MIELFTDISKELKEQTKFWVNVAFTRKTPQAAAETILNFQKTLKSEKDKEYVDFCFKMELIARQGEFKNEDNSNWE